MNYQSIVDDDNDDNNIATADVVVGLSLGHCHGLDASEFTNL